MPTSCVFIKKKAFPRWKEIHKIFFTRPLLPGRRNDLADDEREKAQGPCSSVHWAFILRWTCLPTSLFNTFSPTEAEPVPRPGVEIEVELESRLYSHIPNRLLKSFSFRGVGFILGNQTSSAGQEIFSELILLAWNLIFE